MTEFIAHRVNKVNELQMLDMSNGVEIDLRDSIDGVHLSHDPFEKGESFEAYLKKYNHGTMILNIKSERIEHDILRKIKGLPFNYFFLDSSFPMIKLLSELGEENIAVRFSELEGLDTIRNLAGRVNWIWVDCFTRFPLTPEIYKELKSLNYKICIVSPELQAQPDKLEEYADYMKRNHLVPDAICSKIKFKETWERYFSFD
ncbi:hypothetical protein [Vibrio coralliilyticus]|jgi:hypothetical protein|uniref:hypothetical protein n=1 Tax=Vibrio coralliilyticus TaxID=190893 RepID=UPI00148C4717|nr:hypothetical protein [Vibrio coralliilyticus]NOI30700.1 hypothetical protein [Vibrio coralliilyticus]NOI49752.1 hypothetical protein [Vibrio coralliilyticus]WFB48016.1 hypothetical protein P6988_01975 [Vibrio coralliilyticus]